MLIRNLARRGVFRNRAGLQLMIGSITMVDFHMPFYSSGGYNTIVLLWYSKSIFQVTLFISSFDLHNAGGLDHSDISYFDYPLKSEETAETVGSILLPSPRIVNVTKNGIICASETSDSRGRFAINLEGTGLSILNLLAYIVGPLLVKSNYQHTNSIFFVMRSAKVSNRSRFIS